MTAEPIRVVIAVQPYEEPIRGWIEPEGGSRDEFFGWLALAAAIDDVRAGGPDSEYPRVRGAR